MTETHNLPNTHEFNFRVCSDTYPPPVEKIGRIIFKEPLLKFLLARCVYFRCPFVLVSDASLSA
jgi:hypothetical protein